MKKETKADLQAKVKELENELVDANNRITDWRDRYHEVVASAKEDKVDTSDVQAANIRDKKKTWWQRFWN